MTRPRAILVLLAVTAVAPAAPGTAADAAPAPAVRSTGRVRISLRGGFVPGSPTFTDDRTFTEFAETGRIESRYEDETGSTFEAGLSWRLGRRLAVSGAVSSTRRSEAGSFSASLPHPLFFGAPRQVAGGFDRHSREETAVHLDVAAVGGSGRLEWTAFAGPSVIGVRADLVRAVEYAHTYPYDTVRVTGTPFAPASGHALGFNLGAGLDWQVARHLAIAAQARYSRATVPLDATTDDRVDVVAGGVQLAGGVRLDF